MKPRLKPTTMLLFAWVIFAFWGVVARSATLPLPLLLLAISVGGAIFSAFFVKPPLKFSIVAVVVAAILVLDLLFLFLAFERISLATTIAIHYAGPIIVSVLAPVILGEDFSRRSLFMAVLGFVAVAVLCNIEISNQNGPLAGSGILFAIASAFTLAGNIIFQRLYMSRQRSFGNAVTQYNLYMILGYALLIPIWPTLTGEQVFPLQPSIGRNLLLGLFAGIMTQGLAMIMFNSAIRFIDSQTVSLMAFSEVAATILLGVVLYGERISPTQLGAILVIACIVYLAQRQIASIASA